MKALIISLLIFCIAAGCQLSEAQSSLETVKLIRALPEYKLEYTALKHTVQARRNVFSDKEWHILEQFHFRLLHLNRLIELIQSEDEDKVEQLIKLQKQLIEATLATSELYQRAASVIHRHLGHYSERDQLRFEQFNDYAVKALRLADRIKSKLDKDEAVSTQYVRLLDLIKYGLDIAVFLKN